MNRGRGKLKLMIAGHGRRRLASRLRVAAPDLEVVSKDPEAVVMNFADYQQMLEDAEDAAARLAIERNKHEERIPAEVVDRLIDGENRIRVWREHRGITLIALAATVGVSKGYISDLESGKKTGPSLPVLRKIAEALRVDLDDIA